jgi:hypothetical protein
MVFIHIFFYYHNSVISAVIYLLRASSWERIDTLYEEYTPIAKRSFLEVESWGINSLSL